MVITFAQAIPHIPAALEELLAELVGDAHFTAQLAARLNNRGYPGTVEVDRLDRIAPSASVHAQPAHGLRVRIGGVWHELPIVQAPESLYSSAALLRPLAA